MEDLEDYCTSRNLQLIMGCEANAHHTIWGSTDKNRRGENLFEFIIGHNREILNLGSKPAYVNSTREQVIDIALCTQFTKSKISKSGAFLKSWLCQTTSTFALI